MAGIVYFKSALWLAGLGGLGYGLMVLTTPSQEKLDEIKAKSKIYMNEEDKRKALFMKHLQEAATDDIPIYLQKPGNKKN